MVHWAWCQSAPQDRAHDLPCNQQVAFGDQAVQKATCFNGVPPLREVAIVGQS
jgi:hypothetical protein